MRTPLALCALAITMGATPTLAQPQPRGSYERVCSNIRMEGQFLSATCRGERGTGQSSINVMSCASDIGVDAQGGLTCAGPGVAPGPGGYPGRGPDYDDRRDGRRYDDRRYDDGRYDDRRGYGRYTAILSGGRGRSIQITGDTPNLADTGLNDRVRSIELHPRSGPWIVCTDARYRGRCVTIDRSVADTRDIGMGRAISSLRPAR